MAEPYVKSTHRGVRMYVTEGNQVQIPATTYSSKSWTDTLTGVKNPEWKQQVERHVNAATPLTATSTNVDHSDGSIFVSYQSGGNPAPAAYRMVMEQGWLVRSAGPLSPVYTMNNAASADAAGKFYSKARNELHAIQGGELIGEMGKTAQSVIKITSAMVNGLTQWKRNIRRATNAGPRRWAAGISDAYLEWKFGWDPLAKDVNALLGGFKHDYFESTEINATSTVPTQSGLISYTESLSIASYDVSIRSRLDCSVRYRGELSLERTGAGGFVERLGLSPNNFVPTIYNLLPWTYMIDYFTNIGNIVNAVGFPVSRIRWCVRTIRNVHVTEILAGLNLKVPAESTTKVTKIAVPQSTTWTTRAVTRQPNAAPPFPTSVTLKVPSTFTELGRRQWLNVAAVIANRTWSRNGNLTW